MMEDWQLAQELGLPPIRWRRSWSRLSKKMSDPADGDGDGQRMVVRID